ncbi:antitoxin [Candidatus Poribacteria bacterium]|nr:MAG: antitoxin [Candidatus Poribacteria bacterium]
MAEIVVNPRILGGKPIIKGTRISVEFILDLLASDVSEEEILEDYPHLTKEEIHACLRYAARCYKNEVYLELEPVP